jgi:NAD(P) transhydrogenase subunit alpha
MNLRFHKWTGVAICLMVVCLLFLAGSTRVARAETADTSLAEVTPDASPDGTAEPKFSRNDALIASFTIFSLAVFVGFEIITKVPPTLHTPLMSGSNAISGITLVGAALVAGGSDDRFAGFLGVLAVALAAINVVGGFLVTDRMLAMFRKK